MRSHLVLADKLTNDFAQWARASLHKEDLAYRLSRLDITDYRTLGDLRNTEKHFDRNCAGAPGGLSEDGG
jgi:Family of unknown function (DUF5752)